MASFSFDVLFVNPLHPFPLRLNNEFESHHILQGIGTNRPLSDLLRTLDMASIVFGSDLKLESWMRLYLSQTQEH